MEGIALQMVSHHVRFSCPESAFRQRCLHPEFSREVCPCSLAGAAPVVDGVQQPTGVAVYFTFGQIVSSPSGAGRRPSW